MMIARGSGGEPQVLLVGDPALRPVGLERALGRAGFRIAEQATPTETVDGADAAVLVIPPGTRDIAELVDRAREHAGRNVPIVALLPVADPVDVVHALAAGAADAIVPPLHLAELAERLHARLRERQIGAEGRVAGAIAPLIAQAAGALRTDELLRLVATRLSHALDLARAEVLLVHPAAGYARRVGMVPGESLVETRLDLAAWSAVGEAATAPGPVLLTPPSRPMVRPMEEAARALALPVPRGPGDAAVMLLVPRAGRDLSPAQVLFAQEMMASVGPALDLVSQAGALALKPDPLTGLDLGRAFERRVLVELERSRRYALGFSIVMLDVDGLAAFNEARGSDEGDELLKRLAELLAREVRLPDAVARLGGDEFGLLLPETGLDGAQTTVRRIRARLEDVRFGVVESPGVSVGVVTLPYPDVHHPDEALALAEAALLRGKAQGGEKIGTV